MTGLQTLVKKWTSETDWEDYWIELGRGGCFSLPREEMPPNERVEVIGSGVHHAGDFYLRLAANESTFRQMSVELNTYMRTRNLSIFCLAKNGNC